jgi:hypothetical protein
MQVIVSKFNFDQIFAIFTGSIAENSFQQNKPKDLHISIPEPVIRNSEKSATPLRWGQPGHTGPSPKSLLSVDVDVTRVCATKLVLHFFLRPKSYKHLDCIF